MEGLKRGGQGWGVAELEKREGCRAILSQAKGKGKEDERQNNFHSLTGDSRREGGGIERDAVHPSSLINVRSI